MRIRDLLERDPFREIEGVVKITDHDPIRVWREMDEYVPTEKVKQALREVLETLLETKRGATERACVWVSGFFGSGKSHFLKVVGYLLENRELRDADGRIHRSQEFLCRKFGLENYLPHLQHEFRVKVLFINLLDCDPQNPELSTISRLILRSLLEAQGFSTSFWIAEWEKELRALEKWEDFRSWVQQKFRRSWEDERKLNAETVLKQALPALLPDRYRSEEEASQAVQESKRKFNTVEPSRTVGELVEFAERMGGNTGRVVVLLDEVGLYIGDSVDRLKDLNSVAEQVVQRGNGKILLIASAQEALRDLVPRLTRDAQILSWLQDRFRAKVHLEPAEVQEVVAERLLKKTPGGAQQVSALLEQKHGTIRAALVLDSRWQDRDFVAHYPCPPYAVRLIQDVMGSLQTTTEEARRLSGAARSVLQLVHGILRGEGGMPRGAEQPLGWFVALDLFFDSLRGALSVLRSEQMRAFSEIERLGDVDGLPVLRIAKVLFLLQHVGTRYPCTVDNLASALVSSVDVDIHALREKVRLGLQRLREQGWVAEEGEQYRLLTPAQHVLEQEVNRNHPTVAELKEAAVNLLRDVLRDFRYEHGEIRRQLAVSIEVDGTVLREGGVLKVALYTPLADVTDDVLLEKSIGDGTTVFWEAAKDGEFGQLIKRAVAVRKTLEQWRTRPLSEEQGSYRDRLEKEDRQLWEVRLPQLVQSAFMRGKCFIGGNEVRSDGDDFVAAVREQLRGIAHRIYTDFIDRRPMKDDDCAAILTWRPGNVLPSIYSELYLITPDQQIMRDNRYLKAIKSEIQRRQNTGPDCSGKALVEHFEGPPYGWDPRLVRLLAATLVKAGLLGVRYQGRDITDPNDPQLRAIFSQAREFQRAAFEILPEVDWRRASELCSRIFGVQGGDTFERTAALVQEQSRHWCQLAGQLATRCRDNSLPQQLEEQCHRFTEHLHAIAQTEEPNARLRRFLEVADGLEQDLSAVRRLKEFDFDRFRLLRLFVRQTQGWGENLEGENAGKWRQLSEGINAPDVLDRWDALQGNFAALWNVYLEDYVRQHRAFQDHLAGVLEDLRKHPSFAHQPDRAENLLQPLRRWQCDGEGRPAEPDFVCSRCRLSFSDMAPGKIQMEKQEIVRKLDGLLPKPPRLESLRVERTVDGEGSLEAVVDEVRRYFRQAGRPVRIRIEAEPLG